MNHNDYDVLIAGTGVSGLYAALQLSPGARVLLLCKNEPLLSNTALAQGGIASVINVTEDSYESHFNDTLVAGGYANRPRAVETLVTEGPENTLRLQDFGVGFDLDEQGQPHLTLEGGHSRPRILHHRDCTGREIAEQLLASVQKLSNVDILPFAFLADLKKVENGFCSHVLTQEGPCVFRSRFVILATGGIGRLYPFTTNSAIATGDGIALAHRLGAEIKDLSLIQFHPTVFAGSDREQFLISESVRGEGAYLLNHQRERFMHRYDERLELAPRDVVSQAILREEERTGSNKFYIDISHVDAAYVKTRFPTIYESLLGHGFDLTKDPIPVYPCHHYLMGGIDVGLNSQSTVDGLYAVGECSHTGVHGNNRLASNSLLEGLVFSKRAAREILERLPLCAGKIEEAPFPARENGNPLPLGLRTELRQIMRRSYFVFPHPEEAKRNTARVEEMVQMLAEGGFAVTPSYLEVLSLATVALLILKEVVKK